MAEYIWFGNKPVEFAEIEHIEALRVPTGYQNLIRLKTGQEVFSRVYPDDEQPARLAEQFQAWKHRLPSRTEARTST